MMTLQARVWEPCRHFDHDQTCPDDCPGKVAVFREMVAPPDEEPVFRGLSTLARMLVNSPNWAPHAVSVVEAASLLTALLAERIHAGVKPHHTPDFVVLASAAVDEWTASRNAGAADRPADAMAALDRFHQAVRAAARAPIVAGRLCSDCGGAGEVLCDDPTYVDPGDARYFPCERCDGTGLPHVAVLERQVGRLWAELQQHWAAFRDTKSADAHAAWESTAGALRAAESALLSARGVAMPSGASSGRGRMLYGGRL